MVPVSKSLFTVVRNMQSMEGKRQIINENKINFNSCLITTLAALC